MRPGGCGAGIYGASCLSGSIFSLKHVAKWAGVRQVQEESMKLLPRRAGEGKDQRNSRAALGPPCEKNAPPRPRPICLGKPVPALSTTEYQAIMLPLGLSCSDVTGPSLISPSRPLCPVLSIWSTACQGRRNGSSIS